MPDPSWLESRKKKSRRYGYAVFLIIILSAAFIFLRNNRELLFSQTPRFTHAADTTHPLKSVAGPGGEKSVSGNRAAALVETDSVVISDIPCRLRSGEAFRVVLSLKLVFPSGPLQREVLLKRENLKVMVQKTIAEKTMNELIVDSLRKQTKYAMNRILEKGVISDVEFRNFSIEKVH